MLHAMHSMRQPIWLRYGAATLMVAATAAVRMAIDPVSPSEAPLMLFTVAVTGAAWFGGFGPGVLATLLSAAVVNYRFMEPWYAFALVRSSQVVALVVFIGEGIAISLFLEHMRRTSVAARRSEAQARDLEKRILDISEEEQLRIGHDLHDGLGQDLTGVAFLSKVLSQRLATKSLPEANEARQINELVNESIGRTRDIARGLSPVSMEGAGLGAALRELADKSGRLFDADVQCAVDSAAGPVEDTAAIHVYRIAQEAISNAAKHARAKRVNIELRKKPSHTVLTITNDGKPYIAPKSPGSGMGLQIMRYRARMIGAELDIQTLADGRTSVICSIPDPA